MNTYDHSIMKVIYKQSIHNKITTFQNYWTIDYQDNNKNLGPNNTIHTKECSTFTLKHSSPETAPLLVCPFVQDQMGKPSGGMLKSSHRIASRIRSSGTIRCRKDQVFEFHLATSLGPLGLGMEWNMAKPRWIGIGLKFLQKPKHIGWENHGKSIISGWDFPFDQ